MDILQLVHQHLGLIVFTIISVGLIAYLAYSLLYPERL
jgi:K+-transporting ATPase KdpF subunit